MPGERHSQQITSDGIHGVVAFSYPTEADRLADTNRTPTLDPNGNPLNLALGVISVQDDTREYWVCDSVSPLRWVPLSMDSKSGLLIPGNFAGNPKVATVTFATPYLDATYTAFIGYVSAANKAFNMRIENKLATGFDVNAGTNNISNLVEVSWHALPADDP